MRVPYHPAKSLHKELFDPENWERWIHPELLAFIKPWRESEPREFGKIDLDSFEGCRLEAPGIISFPAFTDEFCEKLLAEVKNYHSCGMPSRAPNSMNNYGLVLNQVGMYKVFTRLLQEVMLPIGAVLFGDDEHRVKAIRGVDPGTQDWGGSTLDDHHSFVVQYKPDADKHLDMHIDECDVTFNFGITDTSTFEGNDLTFCGMFDSDDHRKYHYTYKHVKGRAVVHSGKRRHGALDIQSGERASLIMWTKSRSFRNTPSYRRRYAGGLRQGPADRVCLSYTHDTDYKRLMPKQLQYQMPPKQELDALSEASTRAPLPNGTAWVRVCVDSELLEGQAKMIEMKAENTQISVWRYKGALYALDNRCAHMGGPLCQGDLEDLGSLLLTDSSLKLRDGAKTEDGVVKCPRHGMCFNLRTGKEIEGSNMRQKVYPVRVTSDDVIEVEADVEMTPEEAAAAGAVTSKRDWKSNCEIQ